MKLLPSKMKLIPQNFLRKKDGGQAQGYPPYPWFPLLPKVNFWYRFPLQRCYVYYEQCAPFYDAVELIANEIATIRPLIFKKSTKEFIDDHPLLDLLAHPNTDMAYHEFVKQFALNYLISGNNFIYSSYREGEIDKPPLELYVQTPQTVYIQAHGLDGFANYYQITNTFTPIKFFRENRDFRFFDNLNPDYSKRELYQTKEFSPYPSAVQMLWGQAKAYALYYELEQYLASAMLNLSTLRQGARPSGALTVSQETSDEEFNAIQMQLDANYAGEQNGGKIFLLRANDGNFAQMSQTNKDMDFATLRSQVTNAIYNCYKIPLPLISPDTMTLANISSAKLMLYDNAVVPLTRRIFSELTDFLMKRYDDSGDLSLSFDPREVPALEPRHVEQLKTYSTLNVLTINEVRKMIGYEPIKDGGDEIYVPANLVPIGGERNEPSYTNDEEFKNINQSQSTYYDWTLDEQTEEEQKKKFFSMLAKKKNKDGTRKYPDDEIKRIWDNEYNDHKCL